MINGNSRCLHDLSFRVTHHSGQLNAQGSIGYIKYVGTDQGTLDYLVKINQGPI